MRLSDQAMHRLQQHEHEEHYDIFNKSANTRKRVVYWIGFLDGLLSSHRIEEGEQDALLAETTKFTEFFNDPDASDLAEDIQARCYSSEKDLMDQMHQVIVEKRAELRSTSASVETDAKNEFLGFCAGIICDGRVLEAEVRAIDERFKSSHILMNAAPFSNLRATVEAIMEDGILTDDGVEEIRKRISQLVGDGVTDTGIASIGMVAKLGELITDSNEITFEEAVFVLTGQMQMGPRPLIVSEIENLGGTCAPRATRKTDYVVISSTASRHWRTTHFGAKIERARELIEEGHKLRFVPEVVLENAIRLRPH